MKYSGYRKLLCELSKLSKLNAFILLGYTRRTLMHLFLFTNIARRELVSNMYAENTQQQLTFLTLLPWMHLFLFQTPPRENWFQYIRKEYAKAINFPYIITLL